ncbi:uncharacterized protein H6S33_013138 [Morchella sextelata]|uniref:uncharacterized protein n=1 Tax=Morchella sextelata TaxID=1174677 RepID=UPI001D03AA28|nr:uncharacterized protein H6S33_013138 [Morchella sextelata]KAH0609652.1 hypothetical protein H6S33_013138 [Morchella sextelata]
MFTHVLLVLFRSCPSTILPHFNILCTSCRHHIPPRTRRRMTCAQANPPTTISSEESRISELIHGLDGRTLAFNSFIKEFRKLPR